MPAVGPDAPEVAAASPVGPAVPPTGPAGDPAGLPTPVGPAPAPAPAAAPSTTTGGGATPELILSWLAPESAPYAFIRFTALARASTIPSSTEPAFSERRT